MIRLIATDMDGTLLDSKKQLPPDFDVVMRKLYERDILFAVASGRSYATLKKQFEDYLDDIVFIYMLLKAAVFADPVRFKQCM